MSFDIRKTTFAGFVILIVLMSCSIWNPEPTISPPCSIEDVMIDKSLFNNGWSQSSLPDKRNAPIRWGADKLGVGFITQENGVAGQEVYRGRHLDDAEKGYFNLSESWFRRREDEGDWYIPSEFNYESAIADQERFGCSVHQPSGFQTCQLSAQYNVYVVRFYTGMSPMMSYNDLERILQAIDTKMATCLNK